MHFYDSAPSLLNPCHSAQGTLKSMHMAIVLFQWKPRKPAKMLLLSFSAFLEMSGNTVVRKIKTD